MANPADVFQGLMPSFEQPEAEAAVHAKRMIQSFNAQPLIGSGGKIIALAIKWQLSDGNTETVILAPYAASVLRMMLSHLEENKWTELATLMADATRQ